MSYSLKLGTTASLRFENAKLTSIEGHLGSRLYDAQRFTCFKQGVYISTRPVDGRTHKDLTTIK